MSLRSNSNDNCSASIVLPHCPIELHNSRDVAGMGGPNARMECKENKCAPDELILGGCQVENAVNFVI